MTKKSSKIELNKCFLEVTRESDDYIIGMHNKTVDEQLSVMISRLEYEEFLQMLKDMYE